MGSVGIDLLEIERLERALARRPRLAERLFTEAERAYAAARPAPRDAPRRALLREGGRRQGAALEVWNPHDVEVVREDDGAPSVRLWATRPPARPSSAPTSRSR